MKIVDITEGKKIGTTNGGYLVDIDKETKKNKDFRHTLYTAKHSQLVLMSLGSKEDIGMETHPHTNQFIRVESGSGFAILDGHKKPIRNGSAIVVPAGTEHNIVASTGGLKLYTVYSPPHHKRGTVHKTKADAEKSKEHFDGKVDKK